MNVQSVFDKVIEAGFYSENLFVLMCHAIKVAARNGLISKEEYILAKSEIDTYLGAFGSLAAMLDYKEHPWHFSFRLAIYKDWANRPKFK